MLWTVLKGLTTIMYIFSVFAVWMDAKTLEEMSFFMFLFTAVYAGLFKLLSWSGLQMTLRMMRQSPDADIDDTVLMPSGQVVSLFKRVTDPTRVFYEAGASERGGYAMLPTPQPVPPAPQIALGQSVPYVPFSQYSLIDDDAVAIKHVVRHAWFESTMDLGADASMTHSQVSGTMVGFTMTITLTGDAEKVTPKRLNMVCNVITRQLKRCGIDARDISVTRDTIYVCVRILCGEIDTPDLSFAMDNTTGWDGICLGSDEEGEPVIIDSLNERNVGMAFIAESGSGKTTALLGMLVSILSKSNPDRVKLTVLCQKIEDWTSKVGNVWDDVPHMETITDDINLMGEILKRAWDNRDSYDKHIIVLDDWYDIASQFGKNPQRYKETISILDRVAGSGRSYGLRLFVTTQSFASVKEILAKQLMNNLSVRWVGALSASGAFENNLGVKGKHIREMEPTGQSGDGVLVRAKRVGKCLTPNVTPDDIRRHLATRGDTTKRHDMTRHDTTTGDTTVMFGDMPCPVTTSDTTNDDTDSGHDDTVADSVTWTDDTTDDDIVFDVDDILGPDTSGDADSDACVRSETPDILEPDTGQPDSGQDEGRDILDEVADLLDKPDNPTMSSPHGQVVGAVSPDGGVPSDGYGPSSSGIAHPSGSSGPTDNPTDNPTDSSPERLNSPNPGSPPPYRAFSGPKTPYRGGEGGGQDEFLSENSGFEKEKLNENSGLARKKLEENSGYKEELNENSPPLSGKSTVLKESELLEMLVDFNPGRGQKEFPPLIRSIIRALHFDYGLSENRIALTIWNSRNVTRQNIIKDILGT